MLHFAMFDTSHRRRCPDTAERRYLNLLLLALRYLKALAARRRLLALISPRLEAQNGHTTSNHHT